MSDDHLRETKRSMMCNEVPEEDKRLFVSQGIRIYSTPEDDAWRIVIRAINQHHEHIGENPINREQLVRLMFIQIPTGSWKMLVTSVFPQSRYYEVVHLVENIGMPSSTKLRMSSLGPVVFSDEGQ